MQVSEKLICDYDTLVDRLAVLYTQNYVAVAMICDEALDRSGRLLGKVRERHSELRSQQKLSYNTQSH